MTTRTLKADLRAGRGRGYRHRLAARGKIPAVVYGRSLGSLAIEMDARPLEAVLGRTGGRNALIELQVEGKGKYLVLIKEVQTDPLRQNLIHVDFHQVSLERKITTAVPVQLEGEPVGVAQGGVLQHALREVEISCLPADIPGAVVVDVSGLGIGESISVADLPVPPGVAVLTDREAMVAAVLPPAVDDEPAAEAKAGETAGEENED